MDRSWFGLAALMLGLGATACLMAVVALYAGTPKLDALPAPTVGLVATTGVLLSGCIAMLVLARSPSRDAGTEPSSGNLPATK